MTYFLIVSPFNYVKVASTLAVDCSNTIRKVTHCANGSLYSLIENVPADYNTFVAPLNPYVFRNPARGTNSNQHPFGEAIKVAKLLASTPGAKVSIDLADILPYWPYRWQGMSNWLHQISSFIKDKKASGLTNWYGLEIWNEPDETWKNADGISFNQLWKETFNTIRQNDPNEKLLILAIVGIKKVKFVIFYNLQNP